MVALLLVAGCATLGPAFQAGERTQTGKALVYIYRPRAFAGSAVVYDVKVGETVVTTLHNGGYYPYVADPGELEFRAGTETMAALTLDVRAGQRYYVRGTLSRGIVLGRPHLTVVSEEEAVMEIAGCRLIPERLKSKRD